MQLPVKERITGSNPVVAALLVGCSPDSKEWERHLPPVTSGYGEARSSRFPWKEEIAGSNPASLTALEIRRMINLLPGEMLGSMQL